MRWGVFSYWANSYWGGTVAAIGGALVLGALPRIFESKRPRDALLMGFGLGVLANSRPYEGLVFSLPVAVALLTWLGKRRGAELRLTLRRVVLPLAAILLATGAGIAYYSWRVTGNPLRSPYQVYDSAYDPVPALLGLPLGKVLPVSNPAVRAVIQGDVFLHRLSHSPVGVMEIWALDVARMWVFFLGPLLSLPFLLLLFILPRGNSPRTWGPPARFLSGASIVSVCGLATEMRGEPHYAGPMACLLLCVFLLAMKAVRNWGWRGGPAGLFVARGIPAACVALLAIRAAAGPLGLSVKPSWFLAWYTSNPRAPAIARAREEAEELPGRQLVFVRYDSYFGKISPLEEPYEWGWNSPDIASQKVIWADDLGSAENRKLILYFKGRNDWLLDLGSWPPKLEPYSHAGGATLNSGRGFARIFADGTSRACCGGQ